MPYEKVDGEIHCISDLAPFEIPDTWEWCRVGDLFTNMSGLAYKKDSLNVKSDNMVRVLRGGNIGNEEFYFKEDDVWISSEFVKSDLLLRKNYMITPAVSSLEHIGKIALIDKDYSDTVVGGFVLMLIPYFCDDELSQYLLYAFDAKNHRDNCRNITHKSGQAFYNLSRERLMNLPVPLPPMEELKRINAQLKNILPFVSEYAKIDDKINTLNKSFPDVLQKSILQQAVMGKLVPQDENDEPASVLLDRIHAEKQTLINAGKLKQDKHESIIYRRDNSHYEKLDGVERCIDDEIPFEIPDSWEWARLKTVGITQTGNTPSKTHPEYFGNDVPFIGPGDIQNANIDYCNQGLSASGRNCGRITPKGSILQVCIGGSIGKAAIALKEVAFNQQINAIIPIILDSDYLHFVMISPYYIEYMRENAGGTATPIINRGLWDNLLVPIPPKKEQKRIALIILETFKKAEQL